MQVKGKIMKTIEPYSGFEQGPIRPPSEAASLLIRISRNCPWNLCTFCNLYKGTTFSIRPVQHVLQDIDTLRFYTDAIHTATKTGQHLSQHELMGLSPNGEHADIVALQAALSFDANGMKSIFIQDGNSLIIKPDDIIQIVRHLSQSFPQVDRITSYARSQTISKISDNHLAQMADAGLNRIHIGMESGSDKVLKRIRKGVDKATHIIAGQKVKRAGMQLSEYFMPGLGGKSLSAENAMETADTLNQINPDFIRLRTLAIPPGAPLFKAYQEGSFDKLGEVDTARELLTWLANLHGINTTIRSDHVLNLFPEIEGKLPEDKDKMMQVIHTFLGLSAYEQMLFCIGRRTNRIASINDLNSPAHRRNAIDICTRLGATVDNYDTVIDSIVQRFI